MILFSRQSLPIFLPYLVRGRSACKLSYNDKAFHNMPCTVAVIFTAVFFVSTQQIYPSTRAFTHLAVSFFLSPEPFLLSIICQVLVSTSKSRKESREQSSLRSARDTTLLWVLDSHPQTGKRFQKLVQLVTRNDYSNESRDRIAGLPKKTDMIVQMYTEMTLGLPSKDSCYSNVNRQDFWIAKQA